MEFENKLNAIHEKLQKAIELELTTIPPYLTAMYSIKKDTNNKVSNVIRSVFMEEMLHMVLAANLLISIGGKVKLGIDNIPNYPCRLMFKGKEFRDREFDINLGALSKENLEIFLKIELPDFLSDLKLLEIKKIIIPGYTIGEFYNGIKEDLTKLVEEFGIEKVFAGKHENQLSEDYFWKARGKIEVVKNLEDAIKAIDLIVEQGEGATVSLDKFSNDLFEAHYFKFNEIYHERSYAVDDDPRNPPTGEKFSIDYENIYPIKTNCKSSDFIDQPELNNLNDRFNYNYTLMLHQLEEGFNGNPKVFYTAIMNGMHNLSPLAIAMMQTPINGDPKNRHGAPSFEWQKINLI
jgi:hypothetical protein